MSQRPTVRVALLVGAVLAAGFSAGRLARAGAQDGERAADERVRPESKLVPQRQWEYVQLRCMPSGPLRGGGRSELVDELNEHGKRGWELVSLLEPKPGAPECLLATLKRQRMN